MYITNWKLNVDNSDNFNSNEKTWGAEASFFNLALYDHSLHNDYTLLVLGL